MYLNCHSYFSLRYGTMPPETLVAHAKKAGIEALALTDVNNTSGCFPFVQACKKEGIKPILGIEFRKNQRLLYVGIARNLKGFQELNELLTGCSLQGTPLPDVPPPMSNAFIIYEFGKAPKPLAEFADNEFLGIRPHQITQFYFSEARHFPDKWVALSPVTFLNETGYGVHKLLRASALNKLGTQLTKDDIARHDELLFPPDYFHTHYNIYPGILDNTRRLMDACEAIEFPTGAGNNRQTFTHDTVGDFELLKKIALDGFNQRFANAECGMGNMELGGSKKARKRLDEELKVIRQQGFTQYFLITWDFVRYAQSLRFYHVGRGSGANSLVAYCMGITGVDPIELNLYFERFINEHRTSPPDFDIDFDSAERDFVIDYVLKRYGTKYCALVATYETFQYRSIVEELGKVFGIDEEARNYIKEHPDDIQNHHPSAAYIRTWGKHIWDFPSDLGIHPGGIIISERPLTCFTNLKLMPKGVPIVSFDMHVMEDWGFHKYDILGNRGIGHIREALRLIREKQGAMVDIHNMLVIKRDERVKALLRSGDCVGAFYVESPAMRQLLEKLRCDNYIHLVSASSVIRPGVAQSGMMREYIHRFHDPKSFQYLHPVFEEHLGETFGVMVFQEDVLKILHHFAGLDLGESDVIRRLMSGKKAKGDTLEKLRQKYLGNCAQRGYPEELTTEVWRQIESFCGYSFCMAHSASYAVESLQSLYLKAYFPREFFTGVINNEGGFFKGKRRFVYFYEAQKAGAKLHPPCVNSSEEMCTLHGSDIYVGFHFVKGLEQKTIQSLLPERKRGGAFRHLEDFVNRVNVSATQLELLVKTGAFRFMGLSKCETYWEKDRVFNRKKKPGNGASAGLLFDDTTAATPYVPLLPDGAFDQAFDEWELLGFPLCSPFELLQNRNQYYHCHLARDLRHLVGKMVSILGFYVIRKDVPIEQKGVRQLMCYGCWYDEERQFFDTTHYPVSLKKSPFRGAGIYRISGVVREEFGVCSVVVTEMERLAFVQDERY